MLTGGAFEFGLGVGVNYRSLAEITDIVHHFYHSSDFCCNKVFVRQTQCWNYFVSLVHMPQCDKYTGHMKSHQQISVIYH